MWSFRGFGRPDDPSRDSPTTIEYWNESGFASIAYDPRAWSSHSENQGEVDLTPIRLPWIS
jgi:hypothetical protein